MTARAPTCAPAQPQQQLRRVATGVVLGASALYLVQLQRLLGQSPGRPRHLLGDRAVISVQNPVRLSDVSEPQPDLALLRLQGDFYAARHPHPHDVLLIVEVAGAAMPRRSMRSLI